MYDFILKNGHVIDPLNHLDGIYDIGVEHGKIARIDSDIPGVQSRAVYDVTGKYVIPGLVDMHTHVAGSVSPHSHRMLAAAGVTAALDMAGPIDEVLSMARDDGVGLTIASLEQVVPGYNIDSSQPGRAAVQKAVDQALDSGSLGMKALAAVQLLSPDTIHSIFEICNEEGVYVASHCGSTQTGSDINGFLEAVQLAEGLHLHLAHVNTYCRGMIHPDMEEAAQAIDALLRNPQFCSESYLSPFNGNLAICENGVPKTPVCRNCLRMGGYPETQAGLEQAILDGWAMINMPFGGQSTLRSGKEAVDYWKSVNTHVGISFRVNAPGPRYWLATAKRPDGSFVCDGLSTDGGGIPRNFLLSHGLSLVRFGALSWQEFIQKTSISPAAIIGFPQHGSLGLGREANITVVDFEQQNAYMTVSNGKVIYYRGMLCGSGTRFGTTARGLKHVREFDLPAFVIDQRQTEFYRHSPKNP